MLFVSLEYELKVSQKLKKKNLFCYEISFIFRIIKTSSTKVDL